MNFLQISRIFKIWRDLQSAGNRALLREGKGETERPRDSQRHSSIEARAPGILRGFSKVLEGNSEDFHEFSMDFLEFS